MIGCLLGLAMVALGLGVYFLFALVHLKLDDLETKKFKRQLWSKDER